MVYEKINDSSEGGFGIWLQCPLGWLLLEVVSNVDRTQRLTQNPLADYMIQLNWEWSELPPGGAKGNCWGERGVQIPAPPVATTTLMDEAGLLVEDE